jgi:hypothetical protein
MVIPYAGICAGGGWQQPSLPRSLLPVPLGTHSSAIEAIEVADWAKVDYTL